MDVSAQIVGEGAQPASTSSEINFGALRAQAAAMLPDDDAPAAPEAPAVPAVPEPDPTQVRVKGAAEPGQALAEAPAAEVAAAVAKLPADLTDDTLVKVTVDGEEQILPWGEARGKISGGLKFTKNMQALADQRKAFAAEQEQLQTLRTERANLERFLDDEHAVTGFVKQKFPHLFQQTPQASDPTWNPDEIATLGQARTLAEQQAQAVAQQIGDVKNYVGEQIAAANRQLAHAAEVQKHAVVLNSTLADIFTKNPVLNSIPNAEQLLRYEVGKMEPATEADAVEAFRQVASGMVEEIGKHFKATQKIEAVAAAKQALVSHSIEPAGGSSPQLKPTNFKDTSGQVDWKKVAQAAREFA